MNRNEQKVSLRRKLSYAGRWAPGFFWQRLTRGRPRERMHLVIALADHFEPSCMPGSGVELAPYAEQERRIERWCQVYPKRFAEYRDADGRPFVHTYFYPAEQYDRSHLARLAKHCHGGWGEIEVHLHHGVGAPDSAANTRRQLIEFRDQLAEEHGCLSYAVPRAGGMSQPQYVFVHGNFALANSNRGRGCGVDGEMQILAETGCYADMTLPTAPFHGAQIAKINSIYECGRPLTERAPHREGRNLARGRSPRIFPIIVQGPLLPDFHARGRGLGIDNAALTGSNPATVRRLQNWKRAGISVDGKPDWIFIKLHCHGMDPRHDDAMLGSAMRQFLRELVDGAEARGETLHFVSAREMVNIMFAACDGREGSPGDYRDYRFKRERPSGVHARGPAAAEALKG
jgi:hypothetical protein